MSLPPLTILLFKCHINDKSLNYYKKLNQNRCSIYIFYNADAIFYNADASVKSDRLNEPATLPSPSHTFIRRPSISFPALPVKKVQKAKIAQNIGGLTLSLRMIGGWAVCRRVKFLPGAHIVGVRTEKEQKTKPLP